MSMEYKEFIKTVEIDQINLSKLYVDKNEDYASGLKDISIGMDYEVKDHDVKSGKLHVLFGMSVVALSSNVAVEEGGTLRDEDIDSKEKLFIIETVFNLSYVFKGIDDAEAFVQENEQHVKDFCERNVPINAWPYLREIINSSTVRMGVPPLTIPAFKRM